MKMVIHRRRFLTMLLGISLVMAGWGGAGQAAIAQSSPTVTIQGYQFQPVTLNVPVGATVTWMNMDPVAHTVTSDTGVFDSGPIAPGAGFRWTFNNPGTYYYHCNIHPYMRGIIVVGSGTPPPSSGPSIAVSPNPVTAGATGTVTGTGFTPNNWVFVYWQRPDATTNGAWAQSDANGAFSLTIGFEAGHGTGTEWITAYDWATARWAPWVAETVAAGAAPAVGHLDVTPSVVSSDSTLTISGTGFTPNTWIDVVWNSLNGNIFSVWKQSDATGSFSFPLIADQTIGCGRETLIAYDSANALWSAPITFFVNC